MQTVIFNTIIYQILNPYEAWQGLQLDVLPDELDEPESVSSAEALPSINTVSPAEQVSQFFRPFLHTPQ